MGWRVIGRIGFTGDADSTSRNRVAKILVGKGFQRTKTGTWEKDAVSEADARDAWKDVLDAIVPGATAGAQGKLKHLWLYVDDVPAGQPDEIEQLA